jgi:hypothetical protein
MVTQGLMAARLLSAGQPLNAGETHRNDEKVPRLYRLLTLTD